MARGQPISSAFFIDAVHLCVALAHIAQFIVADITDPTSIAKELEAIVPRLAIPVQP